MGSFGSSFDPNSFDPSSFDFGTGPPVIATADLPTAILGVPYSYQLVATGAVPITWAVDSGSLPAGLTLSSDGLLSGTPSETGSFMFVVSATNVEDVDTQSYTLEVSAVVIPTDHAISYVPLVFARYLDRLKYLDYATLLAAAIVEAESNRLWAKYNHFGVLRVYVRGVPPL